MVTNPHKGDVGFKIGDKNYTLRYSNLALIKLEEMTNKGLYQIMTEMSKPESLRLGTVCALLWAGLQKHHPTITMDSAADLLDEFEGGTPEVIGLIDKAFGKAFSQTLGTKGTNPTQEESNGIGMGSSWNSPVTDLTPKVSGTSPRKN